MSNFKFEHNGEEYEFEKDFSVVRSPKWLRANRRRDEVDLVFTIIEELGGDDVCDVVDEMDEAEFQTFVKAVMKQFSKDSSGDK
ncbi:hypothetical protein [Streptomyces collinus]|uniref:hypothetical protein n=1 Tax=Streptomyces collinus TaxID=42684 RepID=UPI0036CEAA48